MAISGSNEPTDIEPTSRRHADCCQSVKCDQKIKEEAAKKASPKDNDNAGEVSMKKSIHTMIHRQQQQGVLMKVKATAASCALCKCWPV